MYNSVVLSIFTILYNRAPELFHLEKLKLLQDGNKDTDLLKNGLEDMGRGRGEM